MLRAACIALALLGAPAQAQEERRDSAILTIVPDRLLAETLAGREVARRHDVATRALMTENRRLEAQLEAEERELTARRATTETAEFQLLAEAFDQKADLTRDTQDQKARDLTRMRDTDRQAFFQAAVPILATMMQDMGALAILDRSAVFLSFDLIDVTDQAIGRVDAELGDGAAIFEAEPAQGAAP